MNRASRRPTCSRPLRRSEPCSLRPYSSPSGAARFELKPFRLAHVLTLPRNGQSKLRIGRLGADSFFVRLARQVEREPQDARFEPVANGIRLSPQPRGAFGRHARDRCGDPARCVARRLVASRGSSPSERLRS